MHALRLIEEISNLVDIRYNLQQFKIKQVVEYVNKIVPNKKQFSEEDVDEARRKLVELVKLNYYDQEMLDIMSEHLSDLSRDMNFFANMITSDSSWMDLCGNRDLLKSFPSAYEEVARKYEIT